MDSVDVRSPYNNLDRLVTTEMRPWNMLQGYVQPLYEYARGKDPITYEISNALTQAKPGKVAMLTGIVFDDHLPHGEIDGTIGTAVLGRALHMLGHQVDILVEKPMEPVMTNLLKRLKYDANLVSTSDQSTETMQAWAGDYDIAITIEKLGRNSQGIRHSIMGSPMPPGDSYVDDLIETMNAQGKLTIGFGDGGNEIGFGKIYEQTRQLVPHGMDCGCPCGGGLVTSTATKLLFPAAVSNYGAYAVTAALALQTKNLDLMVDGETVVRLIEDAVAAGCLDGGTVDPTFIGDDGIPSDAVASMVNLVHAIVTQWGRSFDRHF